MSLSSRFSCHRSPHKPVLDLKLLRTSAFEIRILCYWRLVLSQSDPIANPLTLPRPWQQTCMRNHIIRIFSSHVGAMTSAGNLWWHKPNLQQNDLKQFLKREQNLTLVCQKGDNLTTLLKVCQNILLCNCFLCKCVGLALIQKPFHSNRQKPVMQQSIHCKSTI